MLQSQTDNILINKIAGLTARSIKTTPNTDRMQTLTRVVHTLTTEHSFDLEPARDAAAAAIADVECKDIDAAFDLKSSTEKCVFINFQGVRRAVTLADVFSHLDFE